MSNIATIASQVKHNCNISDAKFWGFYSPCGLLLRLRDLFHFECSLKPWQKINEHQIRSWIDEREDLWHNLESHDYQPIKINGKEFDPFNEKYINAHLSKRGYIYGAGYGNSLKPVFLLARLTDSYRKNGYLIRTTGQEIARDLSVSPAMIRGKTIITRRETASLFFWHKFEEIKAMRYDGTLHHAFAAYEIKRDSELKVTQETIKRRILKIVRDELTAYVYHELGEASQRRLLGNWWKELIVTLPHSRAELFLRGLKDVLADTCNSGMLSYIIRNEKMGSLSFYVALSGGFRNLIFPEIFYAYDDFLKTHKWKTIEKARAEGYKKAKEYVKNLKALYDSGGITAEKIEQKIMPDNN